MRTDWKNELICVDDKDAVKAFLKRHLHIAGFSGLDLRGNSNDNSFYAGVIMNGAKYLLWLDLCGQETDAIKLTDISINDDFRGRGLGGMLLKIALGVVFARDKAQILIEDVILDGFTFWPRMGSLPQVETWQREEFQDCMLQAFARCLDRPDVKGNGRVRRELERMAELCRDYPFFGVAPGRAFGGHEEG